MPAGTSGASSMLPPVPPPRAGRSPAGGPPANGTEGPGRTGPPVARRDAGGPAVEPGPRATVTSQRDARDGVEGGGNAMVAMDTRGRPGRTEPVLGDATTASRTIADRYREGSVCAAAAGVVGARIRSRGLIRLGRSWWPYHGHEVTLPAHGYFREMRVAGGLRVVDSWVAGRARRRTTLLRRCLHPALVGPDLARE